MRGIPPWATCGNSVTRNAPTVTVSGMHRMIWRLVSGRSAICRGSSGAFFLVHRSGPALAGGDGQPLLFSSAASADEFRLRFTCEPPAYRWAHSPRRSPSSSRQVVTAEKPLCASSGVSSSS